MSQTQWGAEQADDSLAKRFSWQMNACTWKYGVLCDLIYASVVAGLLVVVATFFWRHRFPVPAVVFLGLACASFVGALGANLYLRNARSRVLLWLAGLPFAVENLNAVLAGGGECFELHFEDVVPDRPSVMAYFASVSEDVFVLSVEQAQRLVLARFGVIGSPHAPIQTARRRYVRMRQIVERALVPLHQEYALRAVRFVA